MNEIYGDLIYGMIIFILLYVYIYTCFTIWIYVDYSSKKIKYVMTTMNYDGI